MTPLPGQVSLPDTAGLREALRGWQEVHLPGFLASVLLFLVLAAVLYFVARLGQGWVSRHIEEVNRRHQLRKWVVYAYAILLVLLGAALFADSLLALGALLAVLLAAVAVALQDVLKAMVGWFYLNTQSAVEVGSRLEVDGVKGDVIDIGLLKTTLLEVGNLVYGQQSTGRIVTVPNARILTEAAFVSAADNLFVWQEVQVVVTFESDWRAAEAVLREAAEELHEEIAPELARSYERLERRYAYKHGLDTPIVYTAIATDGVELTVRFLIHVRRRRGAIDRISRRFLIATEADPRVRLAYATRRIVGMGGGTVGVRRGSSPGEGGE